MKMLFNRFLASLLLLLSFGVQASSLQAELELVDIESIKRSEERGDELYFSITEYSSIESPRHYQFPNFPTNWVSDHIAMVKNVILWEKELQENEAVTLIVSLIERDTPPWNVDDLIGSIKLKAHNKSGKIESNWSIPDQGITKEVNEPNRVYMLSGDQSKYKVEFTLNIKPIKLKEQ